MQDPSNPSQEVRIFGNFNQDSHRPEACNLRWNIKGTLKRDPCNQGQEISISNNFNRDSSRQGTRKVCKLSPNVHRKENGIFNQKWKVWHPTGAATSARRINAYNQDSLELAALNRIEPDL